MFALTLSFKGLFKYIIKRQEGEWSYVGVKSGVRQGEGDWCDSTPKPKKKKKKKKRKIRKKKKKKKRGGWSENIFFGKKLEKKIVGKK